MNDKKRTHHYLKLELSKELSESDIDYIQHMLGRVLHDSFIDRTEHQLGKKFEIKLTKITYTSSTGI